MNQNRQLSTRVADEQGWVLVSAIVLTLLMLAVGLVAAGMIDAGTRRTREQRERESALNVDEGVLYAQSLVMQTAWPSSNGLDSVTGNPQYYPPTCTSSGAVDRRCPNAASLVAANSGQPAATAFQNVDELKNVTWKTKVRDNGGALANAYDPAHADDAQAGCVLPANFGSSACTYDANQDRELWVQSQAVVRGKPRNVVARLRLEQLAESVPQTAVVAGAISITNNGNHGGTPIIDATGSQVIVRCANPASSTCANYQNGQIKPGAPQSDTTAPNLMSPEQLQRFKQRAIMDGHYYPGCPTDPYVLTGAVVWVEGCTSPPNLTSKIPTTPCGAQLPAGLDPDCVNSYSKPGLLIWHCGLADMAGGWTYRGVLYVVNNSDGTCAPSLNQRGNGTCSKTNNVQPEDAITTNGGFGVWGVVAVDGPACLKLGSNGIQVSFDPAVFGAVESYGTVGLVQNTWRELDPKLF
jgi:Tfp pilus assembly protein PilX